MVEKPPWKLARVLGVWGAAELGGAEGIPASLDKGSTYPTGSSAEPANLKQHQREGRG